MNKVALLLLAALVPLTAVAQTIPQNPNSTDDQARRQGAWTLLYDRAGKPTEATKIAVSYRVIVYKDDKPAGVVRDFYSSGKLKWEGLLIADRPQDSFDGLCTWYREDGSREAAATFQAGTLISETIFDRYGRPARENWKSLRDKAVASRGKQEYEAATGLYKKALQQAAGEFGNTSDRYLTSLGDLGSLYMELGNPAEAVNFYSQAVDLCKGRFGTASYEYAVAVNDWGVPALDLSRYDEVETAFREAVDIMKNIFGERSVQYATAINSLGYCYKNAGKPEKAIPYYQQSIDLMLGLGKKNEPEYAYTLANLAFIDMGIGQYDKAAPLFLQGSDILRKALGEKSSDYNSMLDLLAMTYQRAGKYSLAEPLFLDILRNTREGVGEKHPEYIYSLEHLARFYNDMGRYGKAETIYLQTIALKKEQIGDSHPEYLGSISELTFVYIKAGEYQKARPLVQQTLAAARQNGENTLAYGSALIPWSIVQHKLGDIQGAKASLEQLVAIGAAQWKDNSYRHAVSRCDAATLYISLGDYAKAEPLLEKGVKQLRELLGKNDPLYFKFMNNLAALYSFQGRLAQAEPLFIEANNLHMDKIETQFATLSELEQAQFIATFSKNSDLFFSFAADYAGSNPQIVGTFYNSLLFSKSILFRSHDKVRRRILASGDAALVALYQEWRDQRNYLAKVYSQSAEVKKRREIDEKKLEEEANDLEKRLSARSALFAEGAGKKRYTWQDIQQRLKPGEAAIEMARFVKPGSPADTICYAMLIVKPGARQPELVVLKNGRQLEGKSFAYYTNAINARVQDKLSYAQYWQPVGDRLDKVNKIYLAPDGVYNALNLNTLYNTASEKYLADEIAVTLLTNTSDLVAPGVESAAPKNAAIFGYPDYAGEDTTVTTTDPAAVVASARGENIQRFFSDGAISALPGTLDEVKDVAGLLTAQGWEVDRYTHGKATESAIKMLQSPRVLHIATHGFFIPAADEQDNIAGYDSKKFVENPLLRSGLLLAGAQRAVSGHSRADAKTEDGILTAFEASSLDLDNTDLLVLSACETGKGEIRHGEGVYGLRRAFQIAGAKTILMSLWKVDDAATRELMALFYKNWLKTGNKRDAFIKAQRKLRSKYKQPYYWGAFVMIGT